MQDWIVELDRSLFVAVAFVESRTMTAAALLVPMPYKELRVCISVQALHDKGKLTFNSVLESDAISYR